MNPPGCPRRLPAQLRFPALLRLPAPPRPPARLLLNRVGGGELPARIRHLLGDGHSSAQGKKPVLATHLRRAARRRGLEEGGDFILERIALLVSVFLDGDLRHAVGAYP